MSTRREIAKDKDRWMRHLIIDPINSLVSNEQSLRWRVVMGKEKRLQQEARFRGYGATDGVLLLAMVGMMGGFTQEAIELLLKKGVQSQRLTLDLQVGGSSDCGVYHWPTHDGQSKK
ncbi:hypothetical protein VNO78_17880 [Psophocarpus tetragonolobus]|uniref:Uncharacterized protein n=1 Tax=Psophocarpus tetragonolobus TaxID=3891 RepID=A0AAN9SNX8_PSOTE